MSTEHRTLLQNISWSKYEQLLTEMGSDRTARFTYDRTRLEMITPLDEHERCRKLIESMILVITETLGWPVEGYTYPTLKRIDLQRGTEPEAGYYLRHASKMRGKSYVDLASDPPPDFILEVALSRSELNKFAIYAELGIPEVWRYISKPGETFLKGNFFIHYLKGDRYYEEDYGLAFPFLSAGRILQFIDESDTLGLMTALRNLRHWLQEVAPSAK
jgi:Uma2 family endonuclease